LETLLQYGLDPALQQTLSAAGVTTVEKLGEMTPEQLVEIPGIDPASVERIQMAVISFYGQFDDEAPAGDAVTETAVDDQPEGLEVSEASEPVGLADENVDSGPSGGDPLDMAGLEISGEDSHKAESGNIEAPESSVSGMEPGQREVKSGPDA